MTPTIKVDGVSKTYHVKDREGKNPLKSFLLPAKREIHALKAFSFEAFRGETLGLLGVNGAGKTTLIKIISGILAADAGKVSVLDFDPFLKQTAFKKRISLVQGSKNQLIWDLPPLDSFHMTGAIYELGKQGTTAVIEELSALFQIQSFLHTPVRNLSLGQRMRCELVNSLLHQPDVILLDEPTLGLDFQSQKIMCAYVNEYVKSKHATCIVTSHNLKDIVAMANRIVVINQGQKMLDQRMEDFEKSYGLTRYVWIKVNGIHSQKCAELLPGLDIVAGEQVEIKVEKSGLISALQRIYPVIPVEDVEVCEFSTEKLLEEFLVSAGR